MSPPLRALVVEDQEDDYLLTLRALRRAGLGVEAKRVWTEPDLRAALTTEPWDIVLSDHQIPGFGGPRAIEVTRELARDMPIIVISGTIGEEAATDVLKAGASDFIVKGRLTRLVPSIERALADTANRRARAAAEDELKRSNALLLRQKEELERSNAELQQFAYVAAHDLQEPMRMIANHLQVVERRLTGPLDPVTRRSLDHAISSAQRMQGMIRAVLDYALIGRDDAPVGRVALADAVADALRPLDDQLRAAGARVAVGPLPEIDGSREQMARLFHNLVANALKYRSSAPPLVRIEARELTDDWRITVVDNGIGIPPESREAVFRMFHRLDPSASTGSGMGLAICRKIVERHGGAIRVEDAPGGGSRFVITLPAGRE